MERLRIVLADDHHLMREAVRLALTDVSDIEVVGEAETGPAVTPLVRNVEPDLVLLDVHMPSMDGLAVLERLREHFPRVRVVMLSAIEESDVIEAALRAGASAFITKRVDPRDLASAIRQAVDGTVFQAMALPKLSEEAAVRAAGLSGKEAEVLRGVARGLSNKQIARDLWVSDHTVKFHLGNVYRKLSVSNRTDAVCYALDHGLIKREQVPVAAAASLV
jgi:two-component system, NarL family, response regulator